MYMVRVYDKSVHPDHFNAGVLGFTIRVLNTVRWWLETKIQLLALRYFSKVGSWPKQKTKGVLDNFRLDVKAEKLERELTSPNKVTPPPEDDVVRSNRYHEGRFLTVLEGGKSDEAPLRPKRMDNLIGAYALSQRAKKYVGGRRYLTGDPEGDFEPLEEENGDSGGDKVGAGARSAGGTGGVVRGDGLGDPQAVASDNRPEQKSNR